MDAWSRLRETTQARIGLGRAGDGLPTAELLRFQLGHARARDAVHGVPDFDALEREIGAPCLRVESAARDRAEYLLRPDLGRRLCDPSGVVLRAGIPGGFDPRRSGWDLALVVADGLSATAVDDHGAAMAGAILSHLSTPSPLLSQAKGGGFVEWSVAPVVFARNARVALGDEIGERLGARMVAVLIGERPGLTVANSLGVYVTFDPSVGRKDSERNCVSNVHAHGLGYDEAARKVAWLLQQGRRRGLTGVMLKEAAESLPSA